MHIIKCVSAAVLVAAAAAPIAADAQRTRGRAVSVQGANGRGAIATSSVSRGGGTASSTRSIQTNRGYGATTVRNRTAADGIYDSSRITTLNNGTTFGRNTTATADGDGSATFSTTATGPKGRSSTVSGTVSTNRN